MESLQTGADVTLRHALAPQLLPSIARIAQMHGLGCRAK
ncbi:hypothetical protein SAMCFNEI73_pB0149 (plasmid) [Sinorhizobium americanum]|uniref:Uncharacterized protein n=1 Tax=Sinorhizobium americanum TaxID=194963 RepID=A0A1L3LTC6_9HYPH|nr:hypothetical protein SAMCFNEI73_pB0149 [Sinorhizobium americanum]